MFYLFPYELVFKNEGNKLILFLFIYKENVYITAGAVEVTSTRLGQNE